mmetsp:Transcript_17983/g.40248  ORF Transcript_17983/g.40248 Transcript_17983/m.40248 type:complete len:249 (+) Transcript_17983:7-753(+)
MNRFAPSLATPSSMFLIIALYTGAEGRTPDRGHCPSAPQGRFSARLSRDLNTNLDRDMWSCAGGVVAVAVERKAFKRHSRSSQVSSSSPSSLPPSAAAAPPPPFCFFFAFFLSRLAFRLAACASSCAARAARSASHSSTALGSSAVTVYVLTSSAGAASLGRLDDGFSGWYSSPRVASASINLSETLICSEGAFSPVLRSSREPLQAPLSEWNSRSAIASMYLARSPRSSEAFHIFGLLAPSVVAFGS